MKKEPSKERLSLQELHDALLFHKMQLQKLRQGTIAIPASHLHSFHFRSDPVQKRARVRFQYAPYQSPFYFEKYYGCDAYSLVSSSNWDPFGLEDLLRDEGNGLEELEQWLTWLEFYDTCLDGKKNFKHPSHTFYYEAGLYSFFFSLAFHQEEPLLTVFHWYNSTTKQEVGPALSQMALQEASILLEKIPEPFQQLVKTYPKAKKA